MAQNTVRQSIKILIAVWGADYIARLDQFGFSSLLAPGNLPAMARDHDVEFVLLTTTDSIPFFEMAPLTDSIRKYAAIRYVSIDDLITPGHFTTTLHLAFTRGVAIHGADMVNTNFVFWNADFVLSDGSLAHLSRLIEQGNRVIITGTLRASAEQGEALLTAMRSPETGVLSATSRELADVCFRFGHPHHTAKTINQSAAWTTMPSQMLWRASDTTLLARFFQSFMFCLKPTRQISTINGPCDYAFVPEFCPGEPQYLIDDSDDAFILELQPRTAEGEFIKFGVRDEGVRRACMAEWLTAEHIDTGRRAITIRSGDPPPPAVLERAKADFQAYFDEFMRAMPKPLPHRGQYYWVHGVGDWCIRRQRVKRREGLPTELDQTLTLDDLKHHSNDRHRTAQIARARTRLSLRTMIFGPPHFPGRLHPDSGSTRALTGAAADAKAHAGKSGSILVVAPLWSAMDILLPESRENTYLFELAPARVFSLAGPRKIKAALVYLRPSAIEIDACSLLEQIAPVLEDGALVQVVWHNPSLKVGMGWVERKASAGLPLSERLDGSEVRSYMATRRDARYNDRLNKAMPHFLNSRYKNRGIVGYAMAAMAVLLRATGLGSRIATGRPYVMITRGRYRLREAVTSASPDAAAIEERKAS